MLKRIVLVADRGLLNLDNLAMLETLQTPAGTALEYILAVPARRYSEYGALCAQIEEQRRSHPDAAANRQSVHESRDGEKRRVVIVHDRHQALEQARQFDGKLILVTNVRGLGDRGPQGQGAVVDQPGIDRGYGAPPYQPRSVTPDSLIHQFRASLTFCQQRTG